MIYGLIALALAGSASAVNCQIKTEEYACRTFQKDADFSVTLATGSDPLYAIAHTTAFNGAILGVTTDPWDREKDVAAMATAGTRGCTFVSNTDGLVTTASFGTTADAHKCTSSGVTACTDKASGEAKLTNTVTLQHLVNKLDASGAYGLYYQRVTANPIPGATLQWISSNACKVTMPVQFACTGSDCIEVQNIVCASFAGITAGDKGQVNIECKVPPSFAVSSEIGKADGKMKIAPGTGAGTGTWDPLPTQSCLNGKCTVELKTTGGLTGAQNIKGDIVVSAEVQQITGSGAGTWSGRLDTFHTANYNLTRASAALQTLSMPIGVNFLSADATELTDAEVDNKFAETYKSVDSVPFLSTQRVELGAIVKPQHGYLRIVAKVAAMGHWFKDHIVKDIKKSDDTTAFVSFGASCTAIAHLDGVNYASHTTANGYPQAFFKCPDALKNVNAGDLVQFALEWKLAKVASASGKAQLLQAAPEVDPNAQSVEVQVTIQLGGGETNITTGTAEGAASADNTVTYIIIAVCVIAAALILAVVVVAFMCLRNRSQEQLVAMSPKQATVAAVYDISAPKKADVMDV